MRFVARLCCNLLGGIIDALETLQVQHRIKAQVVLITPQQDAEEMYLSDGDEGEEEGPAAAP